MIALRILPFLMAADAVKLVGAASPAPKAPNVPTRDALEEEQVERMEAYHSESDPLKRAVISKRLNWLWAELAKLDVSDSAKAVATHEKNVVGLFRDVLLDPDAQAAVQGMLSLQPSRQPPDVFCTLPDGRELRINFTASQPVKKPAAPK